MSAVFFQLRRLPRAIWEFVKRRTVVRVEVLNSDPLYGWVCDWLSRHSSARSCLYLTAMTRTSSGVNVHAQEDDSEQRIRFVPSPGRHLVRHGAHWLLVGRFRDERGTGGDSLMSLFYRERLQITGLKWSRRAIDEVLEEAKAGSMPIRSKEVGVFLARGEHWQPIGTCPRRPIESVVLSDGKGDRLLADARSFLQSQDWYAERGIPWRRGYLLYGPPGNGKTSLARSIASELEMDFGIVNLGDRWISDAVLMKLLAENSRSVLLLEDIDCIFEKRDADQVSDGITFSGLLNALDGIGAAEGRILFMTTNRIERLDSALIRPGRIDMKVEIGNATREQAQAIFRRFFPRADERLAYQFGEEVGDQGLFSMAAIQNHLIRHLDDAQSAAETSIGDSAWQEGVALPGS